ncbi:MAG: flavodoxin-dependent (E)-4-hydroxy-3-methylbut-2-enyl-diphosphate synthase [Firmicutes bacterium]|nr:flavodoxin-dependent (E)-4-hydroxy-3-methylbut-2-enyl-diphosphate synthase [Bacillota bacterium]
MKATRQVNCGGVLIGGGAPVSIQSMTNTDTRDPKATLAQIDRLAEAGCQIIRLAVPDMKAAEGFAEIRKLSPLPMVADIHFDYRLALAAIDAGADKIRINPGNIGSEERVRAVLESAKSARIPVRIGVNAGSLEKPLLEKYGRVCAEALCESAQNAVEYARSFGFEDIVVSLKSSDVAINHKAHKLFRESSDLPMHIGLTEAGASEAAEMKSAVAIGALLLDGIGETVRVSLTGDPLREVILAKKILAAAGVRRSGIDLVSCPTCGRTRVDLPSIALKVEKALAPLSERLAGEGRFIRVAVMGCEVNGPGEASGADFGVACGTGCGLLIRNGEIIKRVDEEEICDQLIALIEDDISGNK